MIKYQEKLQDFYKMRDTLIAEGFSYPENIEIFNRVEKREIALEIIKKKRVCVYRLLEKIKMSNPSKYNNDIRCPIGCALTQEEYDLLKEVLL